MPSLNSNYSHVGEYRISNNGAPPIVTVGTAAAGYIIRNSVNTPNFSRYKQGRGRKGSPSNLPVNPFSYEKLDRKHGIGEFRAKSLVNADEFYASGHLSNYFGGLNGGAVLEPDSDLLDKLRSRVNAKLLDKLKNQSVNVGQIFAERKMTADLIGNTAIRLATSFNNLKKGDFRSAARALGALPTQRKISAFGRNYKANQKTAIANGWLELQYGWKPLLSDIYGAAEHLAQQPFREVYNKVVSRQKRKLEDFGVSPLGGVYNADIYLTRLTDVEVSATIWFTTTGNELASAKELGLLNPAYLAWELMPYSFVVDWFLPVGNFLNSLDATVGLSFNKGNYTTFYRGKSTSNVLAFGKIQGNVRTDARIVSSAKKVVVQRVPANGFPSVQLPSFKNPFSFEHAANAIALLRQTFKR